MKTADYIVKRLEELGVNEFFGLPGDYNFNFIYAVEKNTNTRWIGCTNELNAGYAADGYARIRGYGAVVTTYGVGELSAINAIAGSMAENIPVVCIVGLPNSELINKKSLIHHNLQNADYDAFSNAYKSIVSDVAYLTKENAKSEIDRVLKVLVKEKKPVYIALPEDVALIDINDKPPLLEWTSDKDNLLKASEKIIKKISNSKNPIIIGDVLTKRFDAVIEYREFAEKSGIPVSNFLMGMDLINMDSANYLGGYFSDFKNPIAQKYVEDTDCLIAVGPIYSDLNSFGINLPYKINNHIAVYGNYTYVEGKKYEDVKMSELLESITKMISHKDISVNKPNIGYKLIKPETEALTSKYLYSRIQEFIKDNDIVFTETGSIIYGAGQFKLPETVQSEMQALWASIGWATPAAMGASFAKPQSRVVLITGDGAHQLSAIEIGTMLRFGLKPIIIVINNNGYSIERLLSKNPNAKFNDIVKMNYAKFARVFEGDVWATKVNTAGDFDKALKVTQIMNKMCYIEACIEPMDTPQLLQDVVCGIKEEKNTEKNKSDISNTEMDIAKIINSTESSSFEYETVVHKVFDEKSQESEVHSNE